jgi:hypothetical protein
MMTLQNNIDLLAVDMTLTRMYDMVVELEDKLSESAVIAVKKVPIETLQCYIHCVLRHTR